MHVGAVVSPAEARAHAARLLHALLLPPTMPRDEAGPLPDPLKAEALAALRRLSVEEVEALCAAVRGPPGPPGPPGPLTLGASSDTPPTRPGRYLFVGYAYKDRPSALLKELISVYPDHHNGCLRMSTPHLIQPLSCVGAGVWAEVLGVDEVVAAVLASGGAP